MRRARPYRGENNGPGKDIHGELDPTPGIREQPGSLADKASEPKCSCMSALPPKADDAQTVSLSLLCAKSGLMHRSKTTCAVTVALS
jgi:hypothetical protein